MARPHQRLYDFTWRLHVYFHDPPNNQTCWESFSNTSYDMVLGNPWGEGLTVSVTSLLGVLSLYIYETNIKPWQALIPTDWHDSGILTPNAAVLIAVFALRLSAGGGVSCLPGQMDREGGGRRRRGEWEGYWLPGLDFKELYWCVCKF